MSAQPLNLTPLIRGPLSEVKRIGDLLLSQGIPAEILRPEALNLSK